MIMIEVECAFCTQKVLVPKLKDLEYMRWPVVHRECMSPEGWKTVLKNRKEVKVDD